MASGPGSRQGTEPSRHPVAIDGSYGEGGGQILRSSLTLSLVTGRPLRITAIRAHRKKPGLKRQHLTAVQAAAEVSAARVEGADVGSSSLSFAPGAVRGGDYHFTIGTAGSATLVLQTVLPALALADAPSRVVVEGGTHNPFAPPFDFFQGAYLPLLARQGPRVEATLVRPGFYPRGGGRIEVRIEPVTALQPIRLADRGKSIRKSAIAYLSQLPEHIARRELQTVRKDLGWPEKSGRVVTLAPTSGPGNHLSVILEYEEVTEVFSGFGRRGTPAERVAREASREAKRYLATTAPVGPHLADQLVLLSALSMGGHFRAMAPTQHTRTNIEVVKRFCDLESVVEQEPDGDVWRIELRPGDSGEKTS